MRSQWTSMKIGLIYTCEGMIMSTAPGSTTVKNVNADQVNSEEAIRNRSSYEDLNNTNQEDQNNANED